MPLSFADFNIPVSIFFGAYGIFLLVYIIYSLFNLFHLLKYGVAGLPLYLIIVAFAGGTILLLGGSFLILLNYDWTYTAPLSQIGTFMNDTLFSKSGFLPL